MSRKIILLIMLFIRTFLLTLETLVAQEEEGEIVIISERVGKEIDQEENDKLNYLKRSMDFNLLFTSNCLMVDIF